MLWGSEGGRILLILGNQDPLVEAEGKVRRRNMGFLGEIEERLSIQTHKIFMDVSREQGETCHFQLKVHYGTVQSSPEHLINNVAGVCLGPDSGGLK